MKSPSAILVSSLVFLTLGSADAAPDARALVDRASLAQYYAGNDGRSMVRLQIVDGQGRKMVRQFVVLRRDVKDGGDQRFLVRFEQPADVRNTVFLVHKKPDGEDDRWLYLPALDLVKRIAASDKRTSFVGSHLFYEDISGRSPKEDEHRLIESKEDYDLVESTPKNPASVEFAKYQVRLRKKDGLASQIEYFDKQGKVTRRIEAAQVEVLSGHPTITRMKVSNLQDGGYTLAAFGAIQYDVGVPDDVFVERSLRSPPEQWLRAR